MKKFIKNLTITLLASPVGVMALNINNSQAPNGTSTKTLPDAIRMISNTILSIIAVIAVLMLIVGGFQYVGSAGNPDALNKAKNTILYAIIGIIVAILAFTVIQFIVTNIA